MTESTEYLTRIPDSHWRKVSRLSPEDEAFEEYAEKLREMLERFAVSIAEKRGSIVVMREDYKNAFQKIRHGF